MPEMAPRPANTQSWRARIVAVARCCGSMHARDVASLVALSSSNVFSRMEEILLLCQSIVLQKSLTQFVQSCLDLFQQQLNLSFALAHAIYHMCRSFAQKLAVAKLPIIIGQLAFQLLFLLEQALALRRYIHLLLINN